MIRKLGSALLLVMMVFLLSGCNNELISQLSERQANEIIAMLEKHNIDAIKKSDKKSFSVQVKPEFLSEATELLISYNLPSADNIEIAQQFPADAMITTPLGEKARLISAIEQRLGQTLRQLEQVSSARVHLSYPLEKENNINSASVFIIFRGKLNEDEYTSKIKRLIKNSVPDISYEDISVIMFEQSEPVRITRSDNGFLSDVYGVIGCLLGGILVLLVGLLLIQIKKKHYSVRFFNKKTSTESK
ncbi:type III secretion system inner membrane ring lipoprotein SctJ [Mixta mediterraneensis]|uniref:type III secretion system inner membrane ring lipoprotein SctJ n=1 Tax=Mixta mediterraneensis TaxID=2758443 RepID=UPI0018770462|nr:type III secretion inner membrane ring lipoprotein SctJ [Mixta mediterraneensis]MBE5251929.1 type III secretion inner membrane ring lipoprotein SctJ [Mixta mediterraneensis]